MINFIRGFGFRSGVLAGVALVLVAATVINKTTFADWIVAPLLLPDSAAPVDVIVVLGAGVIADCVPNNHGLRRVLLAVRHWREQPSSILLFSGGTGTSCRVAEAMARVAREVGVPDAQVRLETVSMNTNENAELSTKLIRAWGLSRVLVVTDRLHMLRATTVFDHLGITPNRASVPIYEGHNDNVSMLTAGMREFFALAYYRARGRLGPAETVNQVMAGVTKPPRRTLSTPNGPIVLLGASYAAGWPLKDVAGVPVINKGIAGQQSFELLERFDSDGVAAAPRAVVLWGFINDIFRSTPNQMDATVVRVKDSYTQMIARARAHGIEPILATEVTARPQTATIMDWLTEWVASMMGKTSYQDQINQHVLAVNQWLIETAAREQLLILQLQSVLAEPSGRRQSKFAQPDGSHITPAGYDMLTTYARPVLREFLVDR